MGVTSGTKLPNGMVVLQGDANNMTKMRCMRCQATAYLQTRPSGKRVFKCDACGREWVAKKF